MPRAEYTDREMIYFLTRLPGMGPASIRKIRDAAGPLSTLFDLDDLCFLSCGFNEEQLRLFRIYSERTEDILNELDACEKRGIRFITEKEKEWPVKLSCIPSPPLYLFYAGELPENKRPCAAVIGSRNATSYGIRMAEFISAELAKEGIDIISGMAVGIDGAAHRGALNAGGKSYAVLGNGVNICYPKENYDIYVRMGQEGGGGLISEYPPGAKSLASHFPSRNRLISGLADVLIVTEARGVKSGSQITVNDALDQGKDVFALPGRITDPLSRGCNDLIKNGAFILTSPSDILEVLGVRKNGKLIPPKKSPAALTAEQKTVYDILDAESCFPDTIIHKTGLDPGKVMSILLKMELDGIITQASGNYYTTDTG